MNGITMASVKLRKKDSRFVLTVARRSALDEKLACDLSFVVCNTNNSEEQTELSSTRSDERHQHAMRRRRTYSRWVTAARISAVVEEGCDECDQSVVCIQHNHNNTHNSKEQTEVSTRSDEWQKLVRRACSAEATR